MPRRLSWIVALLAACRGAAVEGPAEPRATPAPRPGQTPPALSAEPEAGPRLVKRPGEPPIEDAQVTIESPRNGEALTADAARAAVRVTRAGTAGPPSTRLALVLDDHRVRYVDGATAILELGDLVPEDRDLDAGVHRLAALVVHADGEVARGNGGEPVVGFVRFSVGGAAIPAETHDIVYLEPQGTFNGVESASRARLTFALLGPSLAAGTRLRAVVEGDHHSTSAAIEPGAAYAIASLESGDYRVVLQLEGPRGESLADAGRTITVNLDAPAPK